MSPSTIIRLSGIYAFTHHERLLIYFSQAERACHQQTGRVLFPWAMRMNGTFSPCWQCQWIGSPLPKLSLKLGYCFWFCCAFWEPNQPLQNSIHPVHYCYKKNPSFPNRTFFHLLPYHIIIPCLLVEACHKGAGSFYGHFLLQLVLLHPLPFWNGSARPIKNYHAENPNLDPSMPCAPNIGSSTDS